MKLTEKDLIKIANEQPAITQEAKKEEPTLKKVLQQAKTIAAPVVTAGGIAVGSLANIKPKTDFKTV